MKSLEQMYASSGTSKEAGRTSGKATSPSSPIGWMTISLVVCSSWTSSIYVMRCVILRHMLSVSLLSPRLLSLHRSK